MPFLLLARKVWSEEDCSAVWRVCTDVRGRSDELSVWAGELDTLLLCLEDTWLPDLRPSSREGDGDGLSRTRSWNTHVSVIIFKSFIHGSGNRALIILTHFSPSGSAWFILIPCYCSELLFFSLIPIIIIIIIIFLGVIIFTSFFYFLHFTLNVRYV